MRLHELRLELKIQNSNSLVSGLKLQPPLGLGCLDRGLERGQHGVCLGEDVLVVGLALGHGLESFLSLDL